MARLLVPEDQHRRGPGGLVGVHGVVRLGRPHRGHRQTRRAADRLGSAAGGEDHRLPARRHAPVGGRHRATGDRRDRERAGRSQGEGAWRAGLRDAGRSGARPAAAILVALRHLADQPRRADQGVDRLRSDPLARGCGARRRRGGAARLQGAQDQHLPLRWAGALCPHARLQWPRLAGAEHRSATSSMGWWRR